MRPIREHLHLVGIITVTVRDAETNRVLEVVRRRNLIVDTGLDLLISGLGGGTADLGYLAWGNDATAPAATDTEMGNELGRKQVTSSGLSGIGEWSTSVYLAPGDANADIEELAWFAEASATPGSGILYARVLLAMEKTAGKTWTVNRVDTLTGA